VTTDEWISRCCQTDSLEDLKLEGEERLVDLEESQVLINLDNSSSADDV